MESHASDLNLAQVAIDKHATRQVNELLVRQLPDVDEEDVRGFAWSHLWREYHSDRPIVPATVLATDVGFSNGGSRLLTAGPAGLFGWDLASGARHDIVGLGQPADVVEVSPGRPDTGLRP